MDLEGPPGPGPGPGPANSPPLSHAGKDVSVGPGVVVTLDGTLSSDPDGDTLTYQWQQIAGVLVPLSDAAVVQPSFTSPMTTSSLVFRLTVSDPSGASSSDDVTISVQGSMPGTQNKDPIARTTGHLIVRPQELFTLDASASTDPDGDPLTFRWVQVAGPELPIAAPENPIVQLVAPTVTANTELQFQVEVLDGAGGFDIATQLVTVAQDPSTVPMLPPDMEPSPPPPDETPPDDTPPPARPFPDRVVGRIEGSCTCSGRTPTGFGALLGVFALLGLRRRR